MIKTGRNLVKPRNNEEVVYKKVAFSKQDKNTEIDLHDVLMKTPGKYQEAIIYAKGELEEESSREAYQERSQNPREAYKVAVADFLNAPNIDEVDISLYNGKQGDPILIKATDDFNVDTVYVAIYNDDNSKLEEGYADFIENNQWKYTASVDNKNMTHDKIIVRVADKPGNIVEKQKEL